MNKKIMACILLLCSQHTVAQQAKPQIHYAENLITLKLAFKQQKFTHVVSRLTKLQQEHTLTLVQSLLLVRSHYQLGDFDAAEALITPLLQANPKDGDTHHAFGSIMAAQAQNSIFSALSYAGKSLNSFQIAVDLQPENLDYLSALMQFYIAAPSIAGGDMSQGKRLMEEITQLDARAGFDAQFSYYQQDNDDDALEALIKQAEKQFSHDIAVFTTIAHSHWQNDEPEKAQQFFITASQLPLQVNKITQKIEQDETDNHLEALYYTGRIAVQTKDHLDGAIKALHAYIAQRNMPGLPRYQWAHFRLGQLYKFNQQPKKADIYFNWAYNNTTDKKLKKKVKKYL